MTTHRLRVGFAGAGTIARDRHVPGFRAIPGVTLVAVANRTEASSRAAAEEFGFERTADGWRALVDDPELDAIVIGTWPYLHAEITEAALATGKHVLSQARMAMNADEARRMTDAAATARARGLATLLVPASHTYWVDATITRLLADGAIGRVRTFGGAWNEPDVNEPGEWWRHQRRFSGNNIQGMGPLYEVLLRWLRAPAVAVTARTDLYEPWKPGPDGPIEADNPDHASILFEYPDGTAGSLEVSSHSAARGPSTITLVGDSGALRVDLRGRTLERQEARSGAWSPVAINPADVEEWDVEAEFVGAVRREREVRRNPFEVGVAYMAFSDAVVESAATGRRVEVTP
jgi:predicted dehydrogenase